MVAPETFYPCYFGFSTTASPNVISASWGLGSLGAFLTVDGKLTVFWGLGLGLEPGTTPGRGGGVGIYLTGASFVFFGTHDTPSSKIKRK